MSEITIELEGVADALDSIKDVVGGKFQKKMMRRIAIRVREGVSDHIGRASVSRHKCADRLGARYSKFLEFAPARGQIRSESSYAGPNKPYIEAKNITNESAIIEIGNTPGLRRAFGAITISPKKARALTIPVDKMSYARSVSELKNEGIKIFRPNGTNILATTHGTSKKARLRPLYALVKSVTIPQDEGLLPKKEEIQDWALEMAEICVAEEIG